MRIWKYSKHVLGLLYLLPTISFADNVESIYHIPFYTSKYQLGPLGSTSLKSVAYNLKFADQVVIQGRPDIGRFNNSELSKSRATSIKSALINEGIPENKIQIDLLQEAISGNQPNVSLITIVARKLTSVNPVIAASPIKSPVQFSEKDSWQNNEPSVPISAVKRILQTAIEDNLSASATNRLFDLMVSLNYASSDENTNVSKTNKTVLVVDPPKKTEWEVSSNKSLRENITSWSTSSGWTAPEWLASTEYKVAKTTFIEGEFPDVLKQIADTSGLNICVTRNPKNIRVTDHNVSCKD